MAARQTARRKLLDTAADLFYREGIASTGVDRISEQAGVSKRSLYKHFASKDALVAATLVDHGQAIIDLYVPADDGEAPPRQKILAVFDALSRWSEAPDFRGCPFVNAATELADPDHPGASRCARLQAAPGALLRRPGPDRWRNESRRTRRAATHAPRWRHLSGDDQISAGSRKRPRRSRNRVGRPRADARLSSPPTTCS